MEGQGSPPTAQLTNEKCMSGGSWEPRWGQEARGGALLLSKRSTSPGPLVQTTCPSSPPNPTPAIPGRVQVSKGSPLHLSLQAIQSELGLLHDSSRRVLTATLTISFSLEIPSDLISITSLSTSTYLILSWIKERGPGRSESHSDKDDMRRHSCTADFISGVTIPKCSWGQAGTRNKEGCPGKILTFHRETAFLVSLYYVGNMQEKLFFFRYYLTIFMS